MSTNMKVLALGVIIGVVSLAVGESIVKNIKKTQERNEFVKSRDMEMNHVESEMSKLFAQNQIALLDSGMAEMKKRTQRQKYLKSECLKDHKPYECEMWLDN